MIGKCILEKYPKIKIGPEEFSDEAGSTILVRERVREIKMEGAFKRVRGNVISQSGYNHIVENGKKSTIVYSKRDVAANRKSQTTQVSPSTSKMPKLVKKQMKKK